MNKPTILMIDDDEVFLEGYTLLLKSEYQVQGAPDISTGLKLLERFCPDLLLLDISLTTEKEGMAVLPQIKKQYPNLPIVIVTNWDSHSISKEAMLLGADDFFVKSQNLDELKSIIKSQITRDQISEVDTGGFPVAQSAAMQQVLREARKAAHSHRCIVLLTGETGVGKEVVARYIHQHSQRCHAPFYVVNCGAIPETLIESELFGHEKGAFTGALDRKKGKFEIANGGTIFLDEIGSLPYNSQVALHRVIENNEIERLGGTEKIPIDVRIVAAAQSNLRELMQQGKFRDDLYYRLAVYLIHIPPLREREEDVVPLCYHFLPQFTEEHKTGKKQLTQSALLMLKNYHWPGNVRELRNVIERAVIRGEGAEIRPIDFFMQDLQMQAMPLPYESAKAQVVRQFQRNYIKAALARNQGNISKTAEEIGISRQALTKIVQDLHLDVHNRL